MRRHYALLATFVLLLVGAALMRGQPSGWDLRNYHLYDGWAFLHGRLDRDIAAAQLQTYFNPLLNAAVYALSTVLSAMTLTALLAFVQALNVVPLYAIARRALPERLHADGPWLAMALAIVGASGATQLGELGATQGDNLASLPLLCGIALLLESRALAAGALIGAAVGLKLTMAPWGAAALLASLVFGRGVAIRAVASAALAFGVFAGPWMFELWRHFGNPVYPMFGGVFGGPLAPPFETRDPRFLPRGLMQTLFYPLEFAGHSRLVSELWFRDWRVPLWFVATIALPWWRRRPAPALAFLMTATTLGYVGWLLAFGIYRYTIPLEMLAPTIVAALLAAAFPRFDSRLAARTLAPALILVVLATRAPEWGRLPFADSLGASDAPRLPVVTTVVIVGDEPLAYLAPALGDAADYVHVGSNLVGGALPVYALDDRVAEKLDTDGHALLALLAGPPHATQREALARYGLAFDDAMPCRKIRSSLERPGETPPRLCALVRESPAREALAAVVNSVR